jgi:predicted GNAT superfamily acetyltransferase
MVGFVFGFVGLLPGGRVKHCSHMAGVLPAYQNQDIGYRLKCAQREHVLAQQLNVITWTFDPLESRNGYFNLHKLGTIARTYMRNVYGTDPFDVAGIGLPSDRFEVEWHIASSRVLRRLDEPLPPLTPDVVRGMGVPHLNPLDDRDGGFDFRQHAMRERSPVLVEIPLDFRAIRSSDSELARQWRQATRTMFETAFAAGYAATNMVLDSSDKRCWYFLEQWDEEA